MLKPFTELRFNSKLDTFDATSKPLYINPETIEQAENNGKRTGEGKNVLDAYIGNTHYNILEEEIIQTIKEQQAAQSAMKEHTAAIVNLTRALRELRVNIPSSIRMHM